MTSQVNDADELTKTWTDNPSILRSFIEIRPQYEQLCSEIEYILNKRMSDSEIEFSTITSRAKSLKSFAEKLFKKQYPDPLRDITDLAGVRVVYLYKTDRPKIERLIEAEFTVLEKVDKVEEQDADRFGYGALHFLVRIGRKSSGARYDDLKSLVCEIQVRTVLQDAWAIVAHHLSYKQESDIPKILRRKLNSLSGLFETADDQFNQVRVDRTQYQQTVKKKANKKSDFLVQEINLDTFEEFLSWKFPRKVMSNGESHLANVLSIANEFGYKNLSDLNALLDRTSEARAAVNKASHERPAAAEVAVALMFLHPTYRAKLGKSSGLRALIEKYDYLVS